MTRNDHSNQLELSIRPCSGVDSGQCDWGITLVHSQPIPSAGKYQHSLCIRCLVKLLIPIEIYIVMSCYTRYAGEYVLINTQIAIPI